ncbi:hypothetical protein ACWIWK_08185 [Helicobacter sp. 23-1048]
MTKKFIIFLGLFIGVLFVAEYFILGNTILSSLSNENPLRPQSSEDFCSKYPRHRACF